MSESFLELTTANKIEVWRERMKGGALFASEDIENLIGRIAWDDAALADFIQEAMAIPRVVYSSTMRPGSFTSAITMGHRRHWIR